MTRAGIGICVAMLAASCGGTLNTSGERDLETEPEAEDVSQDAGDSFQDLEGNDLPEIEDGLDDCTGLVWYQDGDHDGFGSNSTTATGCEGPPGYVLVGGDCDDGNVLVHPGQYDFFTEPYGIGSYDYNCDGNIELQYPDLHACSLMDCVTGEGWTTPSVPPCGESGGWVRCDLWGPVCDYQPGWRTQGCR